MTTKIPRLSWAKPVLGVTWAGGEDRIYRIDREYYAFRGRRCCRFNLFVAGTLLGSFWKAAEAKTWALEIERGGVTLQYMRDRLKAILEVAR